MCTVETFFSYIQFLFLVFIDKIFFFLRKFEFKIPKQKKIKSIKISPDLNQYIVATINLALGIIYEK